MNLHTNHEVCDDSEAEKWDETHGDHVCKHFREEEGGHSIKATDILMAIIIM